MLPWTHPSPHPKRLCIIYWTLRRYINTELLLSIDSAVFAQLTAELLYYFTIDRQLCPFAWGSGFPIPV